ncbi:TRAFs-binding domain-containing protein [Actinomadura sp. NPDC000600]|uniref:TRAFs-binding domain-containing protein n=1 Tax=Actinomadura sp. NPDC000600 TaxID=3154262 RepID=UPI0033983EB8
MIIAFTARHIAQAAFPPGARQHALDSLQLIFRGLHPRLAIGPALAGADPLPAEAAVRADVPVQLLTPAAGSGPAGPKDVPKPFYDLATARRTEVVRISAAFSDDAEPTLLARPILKKAHDSLDEEEELVVLDVGSANDDENDPAALLAKLAELNGHLVLRLDPTVAKHRLPVAFVAMPYGSRTEAAPPMKGYESDETWFRIIVPALVDRGYRPFRAGYELGRESIDLTMLREIATSDLFVADLATLNANVLWELGVRHAWRPHGSLLVAPEGTLPPFDVDHMPVHRYRRRLREVPERDAIMGIRTVREALARSCPGDLTSPVFVALPGLREVVLPKRAEEREVASAEAMADLVEEISIASDLRAEDRLAAVSDRIEETDLPDASRRTLHRQVGLAYLTLGNYEKAAASLEPLASADTDLTDIILQQRFALTLIHRVAADEAERLQNLLRAVKLLTTLDERYPQSAETLSLLGSAAKQTLQAGGSMESHMEKAISAYRKGLMADPANYYPGINLIALLRLRGQHFGSAEDLEEVKEIVPVVRFAVKNSSEAPDSGWLRATLGELALHRHLLAEEPEQDLLTEAIGYYAAAARGANGEQRKSMRRQLEFFRRAGDPPEVIDRLLALVPEADA